MNKTHSLSDEFWDFVKFKLVDFNNGPDLRFGPARIIEMVWCWVQVTDSRFMRYYPDYDSYFHTSNSSGIAWWFKTWEKELDRNNKYVEYWICRLKDFKLEIEKLSDLDIPNIL